MLPQIPFARRHVPLITTSIEFPPERLPPHPPITTGVEFTPRSAYDSMSDLRPISHFGTHMNEPFFDGTPTVRSAVVGSTVRSAVVGSTVRSAVEGSTARSAAAGPSSQGAVVDDVNDGKSASAESEGEESWDEDQEMIEKPKGEVTRQYKLADVLGKSGWSPERIEKLRLYVHNRADARLDTSQAYTFQKKELISLVCAEARVEFTELGSYRKCWPVIDILKPRLKCTSERARRNGIVLSAKVKGKMKARG